MPAARFPAPAAEIDAAQDDLAIPGCEPAHLVDHLLGRGAPAAAADEGDDAEGAAVIAAVLDFQVRAGAVAGRVLDRRRKEVVLGEDVADVDVAVVRSAGHGKRNEIGDLRFVGISNNPFDSGHRRQLLGSPLRIAAGDENPGGGILAMHATDRLADIVICRGGNGAGIQYDEVRGGAFLGCG